MDAAVVKLAVTYAFTMGQGSTLSNDRFGDHDPDAPWRPGFEGWEAGPATDDSPVLRSDPSDEPVREGWSRAVGEAEPEPWVPVRPTRPVATDRLVGAAAQPTGHAVASVDGQPSSAVSGELVLVGVCIAAILMAVVGVVVALGPLAPTGPLVSSAPLVPTQADVAWTVRIDGPVDDVAVGDDVVAVSSAGDVTAFALDDGRLLWQQAAGPGDGDVDQIAVIGDYVVVQQRGPRGTFAARSIDRRTGEEVWRSVDDEGNHTIGGTSEAPLLLRRTRLADSTLLAFVDPADGADIGVPIRLSGVGAAGTDLAVQPSDRRVAVWSIDRMEPTAGPVDAFNLKTVASLAGSIVALDLEGRIVAFDAAGERVDEQPFVSDAFGEFTGRAALVGVVDEARIGIIASGSSIGFTVDDGSIEVVWQRAGRVLSPTVTTHGTLGVLVGPSEATGEIRESIIDPSDGTTIVVTDPDGKRELSPILGRNAYVLAPQIGARERVLEGFDYGGRRLWSLPVPTDADYEVGNGVVVLVDRAAENSTVSIAR